MVKQYIFSEDLTDPTKSDPILPSRPWIPSHLCPYLRSDAPSLVGLGLGLAAELVWILGGSKAVKIGRWRLSNLARHYCLGNIQPIHK